METPGSTETVVRQLAAALNNQDFEQARRLIYDDIEFVPVFGPTIRGADEYLSAMARFGGKQTILDVAADQRGKAACVYLLHLKGREEPLEACAWFELTDGKVRRLRLFFDSARLAKS